MLQYFIPHEPNEFIAWLATQYIGSRIPYIYGGDDPLEGWDCSGFVHEILQAVGYEKRGYDDTAHGMYLAFLQSNKIIPNEHAAGGNIIFYFHGERAVHTGILITPEYMVHAGGGGRDNTDFQTAVDDNAYLRVDQITYRPERYAIASVYKDAA